MRVRRCSLVVAVGVAWVMSVCATAGAADTKAVASGDKTLVVSKDMIANVRAVRDKLLADPHRPGYHFVSPEGRCAPFDPNAAIFWKGRYHLMYIVQTEKGHCWGHVSSTDLVHWRQHKLALEPGGSDKGIFSGGIFLDKDGTPTITYWGLGIGGTPSGICLATSTDANLDTWTKHPANPVIHETTWGYAVKNEGKDNEVVYGAADPSAIWRKDGKYYVLTGNLLVLNEFGRKRKQAKHMGDTLYLFKSDDMVKWEYMHPFYTWNPKWTKPSEDNMCAEFFPLPASPDGTKKSDRHMILCISHNLGCRYYIGKYDKSTDKFNPELHGRMTWTDSMFFAPEICVDAKGRRIMWAWIHDQRSGRARNASGWSGTMSLPRTLWLGEDNTLRMRPAKELAALRYNARKFGPFTTESFPPGIMTAPRLTLLNGQAPALNICTESAYIEDIETESEFDESESKDQNKDKAKDDDKNMTFEQSWTVYNPFAPAKIFDEIGISGNSIELSLEMTPGKDAKTCGVKVCCSPDGKEETAIYYDATDKKIKIDTRKSSLGEGPKRIEAAPFKLKKGETLKLRIFVDKSVIEVFANDRQALVRRIYPTRKDSVGVKLISTGAVVKVPRFDAWDMMPSNAQ